MPLTLFASLGTAYRFLWNERRDLFAYAFLPVLLVSFVQIAGLWATGDWQLHFEPPVPPVPAEPGAPPVTFDFDDVDPTHLMAFIANGVAAFVAYVMFAVAWFRRYLIGPEGMTVGAAMRWGPRQWRFIARFFMLVGLVLLLGFLITGPINLLTSINPALGIFGRAAIVVGTLLITSRLLLVLPAAAVDQKFGFRDAGNVTRGKSWYMLGIYLFSLLPALFALVIVAQLMVGLSDSLSGPSLSFLFVVLLVQQAIMFVAIASQVTALAEAFRQLAPPPAATT
ncbi:MAG: hypothetical protein HOK98_03635 [Rhodospirillaceae bacterium]|jgi:hypothetical protein|nr:hypothetical protein [Rhodospirillaceae bacterium]MBT6535251.1 hypothetical protein [Rhodospirillaceae bacterium]